MIADRFEPDAALIPLMPPPMRETYASFALSVHKSPGQPLTRDLVYRFCGKLYLSEKREAAEAIGVERAPGNVGMADQERDRQFLIAAKDAGKLAELAAFVDKCLGDRRDDM